MNLHAQGRIRGGGGGGAQAPPSAPSPPSTSQPEAASSHCHAKTLNIMVLQHYSNLLDRL